jgi:hypothetical protein
VWGPSLALRLLRQQSSRRPNLPPHRLANYRHKACVSLKTINLKHLLVGGPDEIRPSKLRPVIQSTNPQPETDLCNPMCHPLPPPPGRSISSCILYASNPTVHLHASSKDHTSSSRFLAPFPALSVHSSTQIIHFISP